MTYNVDVTREGDAWLADVGNLPGAHTWAKNLTRLKANVVEVIRLVEDVPDEAPDPQTLFQFSGVSGTFEAAAQLGVRRRELDDATRTVVAQSTRVARTLAAEGWSVRDISGALQITPGRVSQLLAKKDADAA